MGCGKFAMGYLDDIIIFSQTEEDHLDQLEDIFLRLEHFGLKMKREKCAFFKQHIQYLGHLISEEGNQATSGETAKYQGDASTPKSERNQTVSRAFGILP